LCIFKVKLKVKASEKLELNAQFLSGENEEPASQANSSSKRKS